MEFNGTTMLNFAWQTPRGIQQVNIITNVLKNNYLLQSELFCPSFNAFKMLPATCLAISSYPAG